MKKSLICLLIISVALLSLLVGGCSKSAATTTAGQVFEVKRGDLNINVSSDGHLTMPDEYNLSFGTNGQVQQIFVEEGDKVKQGALLVSLSAVTTTSAGSFVTVVDDATGKQEKREVTLGSQNLQFAEVVSGLKEGDKIVIEEKAIKAPVVTGFPSGRGGSPPPSR